MLCRKLKRRSGSMLLHAESTVSYTRIWPAPLSQIQRINQGSTYFIVLLAKVTSEALGSFGLLYLQPTVQTGSSRYVRLEDTSSS